MSEAHYEVPLVCDRDGCESTALVAVHALGSNNEPRLLCATHMTQMGQRLQNVHEQYDALVNEGVDRKMAERIVSARIDRDEV